MSSPNESEHPDFATIRPGAAVSVAVSRPLRNPRSLRLELLVSQLLILSLVVIGFGGSIYFLVRQATYRQAEADLLGAAQLMVQDLKLNGAKAPLTIAETYRHRFGPAPRDHAYFVVWDTSGNEIAGTDPLPPHVKYPDQFVPEYSPRPYLSQTHGPHLEVIVRGPDAGLLLIGRPLAKEFDHLQRLLVTVTLFGMLSLIAGGIAAWWLASRTVLPLERLTAAAEQISAQNLDQRLEIGGASLETMRLATVFNTMLERLHAAFQRQIRLTADASHELRTPVSVILSQAEHTLTRPRDADHYSAALDTCLKAARRMKRLVDDLLILARADSGKLDVRHENLDLAEVARQVLALIAPLAAEKHVRLSSQLQTTPAIGDAQQLGQVITNLVTNAIQYNREGGEVFVTVNVNQTRAQLTVADTGIGIPQDDLPHLCERFYRADTARTHLEGQGTGLGLSIVAEIVAAHSGTMNVTSEPGVGTTVTVQL